MTAAYVIGYDPGGNGKHGVAALRVEADGSGWVPRQLEVGTAGFLHEAVDWITMKCRSGRIVAAGVDTLTEWDSGRSGFRPADLWLRKAYPNAAPHVVAPNSIAGSMSINGAAFLMLLRARFESDGAMVTEAHPKVCYYTLTGRIPNWKDKSEEMIGWLVGELGVASPTDLADAADDRFDAAMSALAALRGLNGEWTRDLHALPGSDASRRVRFCGKTHYWWPAGPLLST